MEKAREVIYVTDWVMLKAGSGREGGDRVWLHPQWQIARVEGGGRGATGPQLRKIISTASGALVVVPVSDIYM